MAINNAWLLFWFLVGWLGFSILALFFFRFFAAHHPKTSQLMKSDTENADAFQFPRHYSGIFWGLLLVWAGSIVFLSLKSTEWFIDLQTWLFSYPDTITFLPTHPHWLYGIPSFIIATFIVSLIFKVALYYLMPNFDRYQSLCCYLYFHPNFPRGGDQRKNWSYLLKSCQLKALAETQWRPLLGFLLGSWLLASPFILINMNYYIQTTDTNIIINAYHRLSETTHPWATLQEAQITLKTHYDIRQRQHKISPEVHLTFEHNKHFEIWPFLNGSDVSLEAFQAFFEQINQAKSIKKAPITQDVIEAYQQLPDSLEKEKIKGLYPSLIQLSVE